MLSSEDVIVHGDSVYPMEISLLGLGESHTAQE